MIYAYSKIQSILSLAGLQKSLQFHTCCPGFALYNLFTCWRRKSDTFDIDSVTLNVIRLEITVDHSLGYAVHHRFQRSPKIHSTNCKASDGGETSQTSFRTSVRCCISALFEFQSFNHFQCSTRVASRSGYPEFSTKPGRLIRHGPQLCQPKIMRFLAFFSIQMHSLTMHNITSFLDKRMYSNAASECFWTGACKVCASPAVMAHKQPRCPLPLKVLHESVDDSMTLCFGGWHFEFWDDHTSIHLGTCFGRFENEVDKKTLQKTQ